MGRMGVEWSAATGLQCDIDQVPLIRRNTFYVVKAGWTGLLFGQNSAKWTVDGWQQSPGRAILRASAENPDVRAGITLTVTDNSLTVEANWQLLRDIPAEVEYAGAYWNAPLLVGKWTSDQGATSLAATPPPPGRSQEQNRVARAFRTLQWPSPLGPLTLRWESNTPPPVIFDARSDSQEWAKSWPVLWMGIGSPAQPLRYQDGVQSVRWTLFVGEPPARAADAPHRIAAPAWKQAPAVVAPPKPVLWPTPKRQTPGLGAFQITPACRIVASGSRVAGAERIAGAIRERFGIVVPIVPRASAKVSLIRLDNTPLKAPVRPEAYAISVTPGTVRLAGRDDAGWRWAVETLLQWLAVDASGPQWASTEISDWPSMAFRGVHLFHGREALPFHQKLIERVLAPGRFNHLVLQCEQVRWNHDPGVAPSWAGTPDQVRREIAFAKQHGIRMVPLVQGYGHMEWLFQRESNRRYAEDPETPYAVHFGNPDAVRYLEGFVDEANRLFQAGAFHVGLDEVTMRGRFPQRSAGRSFPDLFASAARHWQAFLRARKTETWMWADMLLHPSEVAPSFGTAPSAADAKAVRDALPRDIVLFDWQYDKRPRYPSLDLLRKEGFERRVATTWFQPDGIQAFARAAEETGAWGALQSTWCGYESKESVLATLERRQFTAMVAAAEHFWNGGRTELRGDAGERFQALFAGPARDRDRTAPGYLGRVDFNPGEPHWLPATPATAAPIRTDDGTQVLAGGPLALADRCGPAGLPRSIEIPLPPETEEIRLLVAATRRAIDNTPIGEATWSNGQSEQQIALHYGRHLAAPDDPAACAEAPVAWVGTSQLGSPLRLRLIRLRISGARSLILRATHPSAAPVLYGWTAVVSDKPTSEKTPARRAKN